MIQVEAHELMMPTINVLINSVSGGTNRPAGRALVPNVGLVMLVSNVMSETLISLQNFATNRTH